MAREDHEDSEDPEDLRVLKVLRPRNLILVRLEFERR